MRHKRWRELSKDCRQVTRVGHTKLNTVARRRDRMLGVMSVESEEWARALTKPLRRYT